MGTSASPWLWADDFDYSIFGVGGLDKVGRCSLTQ